MSASDIIIEYTVAPVFGHNDPRKWLARYRDMPTNIPSGRGKDALEATQQLVQILANHIQHTKHS